MHANNIKLWNVSGTESSGRLIALFDPAFACGIVTGLFYSSVIEKDSFALKSWYYLDSKVISDNGRLWFQSFFSVPPTPLLNFCWENMKIRMQITHPPSAAYTRRWTGSRMVSMMACRLVGTKPLSKLMVFSCQSPSPEQTTINISNQIGCHWRNCSQVIVCNFASNWFREIRAQFIEDERRMYASVNLQSLVEITACRPLGA